jgi:prolyl-tRNA synthetase
LRPATDDEIRAIGAVAGYGSPVGVKNCLIVVDDAVMTAPNLVAGANEEGYHYLNVNAGRDYKADIVADVALAREGDKTPDGAGILREVRGVEVGNIFKLGTRYSAAMNATFLDASGTAQPIIMGSYGIGVGRLLACVAEEYHDNFGLMLPISVAPYQVHLVLLPGENTTAAAEKCYAELQSVGIEVLFDDRDERAGVKFNDADLIGVPLRLTISAKSLEKGGAEFKRRSEKDSRIVPLAEVIQTMQAEIVALHAALAANVKQVEYQV